MNGKHLVIIIEDDFDMYNMFKNGRELVPAYDVEVITDGVEALRRLDKSLSRPGFTGSSSAACRRRRVLRMAR